MRILATVLFFDTTYIFFFKSSNVSFFLNFLLKQDAYTINVGSVGEGGERGGYRGKIGEGKGADGEM